MLLSLPAKLGAAALAAPPGGRLAFKLLSSLVT
jgi:hypothetical protein